MYKLFFELIAVALHHRDALSVSPSAEAWRALFDMARRQSLVGVCFSGVERLDAAQRPPRDLVLQWYSLVMQIEQRNGEVTRYARELTADLQREGFEVCILKGQGVAAYYPNPLRRQSGDIDMWLRTRGGDMESDRRRTIDFVRRTTGEALARYHHVEYEVRKGMPVELHFMPTWMNDPLLNGRLQRWFEEQKGEQFAHVENGLHVPAPLFNVLYLLMHIQKHILEEGIGLRQLMDYYYVLLREGPLLDKEETGRLLRRFGMTHTAAAVMYVMKEVFALGDDCLLCRPDTGNGRFLIREMMLSGNFGKYDERFGDRRGETALHIFIRKEKRIVRFFAINPREVLWSPFFAVYQRIWRYRRRLIGK